MSSPVRLEAPGFDLAATMECGQFFHWDRLADGYRITAHRRTFTARQAGEMLVLEGADGAFGRRFFALDHDISAITASLPDDPWIARARASWGSLRLLRQDPWECLIAFLLSPASNIPRIRKNLLAVYAATGFRPERMQDEAALRRLGVGFRARFLADAARAFRPDGTREGLKRVFGVGDKVADCVMLFAYGDYASFPVDTWTKKVLRKLYRRRIPDRRLADWARKHFGPWAGYAQQWLYAWSREAVELKGVKP